MCRRRCWPAPAKRRAEARCRRGRRLACSCREPQLRSVASAPSTSASQSTISAIRPSASTAPPDTGSPSETIGGSGRVTSSRWPTRSSTASARRRSCARMITTNSWVAGRRSRPNTSAPSTSGSTPSSSTSIRWPATERTVCSDRRSVRSMRSSGIANGAPATSTSSAEMIAERQRQADLRGGALARARSRSRPRRRARGSWRARRPCRRRGPEMSLVVSAVEKPGANSSSMARAHVDRRGGLLRRSAPRDAPCERPRPGRCRGRRRARR